jgi:hypothetical protein
MKGDAERCQGLQGGPYVDFRKTCDTNVQIWEGHVNEIFDEFEDLFSRRWYARVFGKFIECVHNEINRVLGWTRKDLFQALYHGSIAGLFCTPFVFQKEGGECLEKMFGLTIELEKDGKEEAPATLLIFVTRVAVKIRHGH